MKKLISVLLALALACALVPSLADGTFTVTGANPEALAEDYTGKWVCAYAGHGTDVFDAASHLEDLGMTELMTIEIRDNTAAFTGMPDLGTDPLSLQFENGAMVFAPAPDVTVFTLQLLQDGALSMKFNMIEQAGVLYLFRAEE